MIYLKFTELQKNFGYKVVLKNITSSIASKNYISLMGANGAGKTTLLYLLSGLYRKDGGTFSFPEKNISSFKELYGYMQVLSHHSMFYSRLSAFDNLSFFSAIHKNRPNMPRNISRNISIEQALEICGLTKAKHQFVDEFSRGMLQRLSIARAILFKPPLLFLDEPFTGLDVRGQKLLHDILLNKGIKEIDWNIDSFVLVDHDLPRAFELTSHCWLIENGTLSIDEEKKNCSQKDILSRLA